MGRTEKSIIIKASPEKVWEMLALDRTSEWDEGSQKDLKSLEYTSEVRTPKDKSGVGAYAHATIKGEGEMHFEIMESLENTKITYHGKGGKTTKDMTLTYILDPVEEGTKLTYRTDLELSWGILGEFLDKLFAQRMAGKEMEKSLEKLKSILEQ